MNYCCTSAGLPVQVLKYFKPQSLLLLVQWMVGSQCNIIHIIIPAYKYSELKVNNCGLEVHNGSAWLPTQRKGALTRTPTILSSSSASWNTFIFIFDFKQQCSHLQYTWHAPTIISFSPSSISLIRLDLSLLNMLNCSSSFLFHIFGRWQLGAKGNVSGRDNSDWNSNRHGDKYWTASLQNSMDNGPNTLTFKQTDQFAIHEVKIWTSWHVSYIWGTAPCDESLIKQKQGCVLQWQLISSIFHTQQFHWIFVCVALSCDGRL